MTLEEFEEETARAARSLPPEFRARLDNVIITVKAAPGGASRRRFGGGLLGLYEGVPLADRGTAYSGAMPDKITLFKNNIESSCRDDGEIAGRIRHTLLHEIAHHFGITDEELKAKGLY
ncbi:MAG TPA: metallopeptidase family protein [Elusimicrobiales bacterium]|nr:metallopeptidase family protein [Elusimicrobiales bacterium]